MGTEPEKIAQEFSALLKNWLSQDELKEVVLRNSIERDPAICHSHDFCDANMAMLEVFSSRGMDIAGEGGVERHGARWNEAWALARKNSFWVDDEDVNRRITEAVKAAEDAFWVVIANRFPECKSGDLSPLTTLAFGKSCSGTVREWVSLNR